MFFQCCAFFTSRIHVLLFFIPHLFILICSAIFLLTWKAGVSHGYSYTYKAAFINEKFIVRYLTRQAFQFGTAFQFGSSLAASLPRLKSPNSYAVISSEKEVYLSRQRVPVKFCFAPQQTMGSSSTYTKVGSALPLQT